MPELNKANRQVCDVDIRILKGLIPFLFFEDANTTTAGLSGESTYAMSKGTRKIGFPNPLEGTMSIECQVYPFKLFSMFSDGTITSDAAYAVHKIVSCTEAGKIHLNVSDGEIKAGTVFVYPKGEYGDEASLVKGTFADGVFSAETTDDVTSGTEYEVGFIINRTNGVQRISFNNNKLPKDYYITMQTLDKDEEGVLTPFLMTAYKATIQRNFELSFSSEGDPATVTLNFDLMEDKDGNILDFIEIVDDIDISNTKASISTNTTSIELLPGVSSSDIEIKNATGVVTAAVSNSEGAVTTVSAHISGDYDTLIISADSSAAPGDYTVALTDENSKTTNIAVKVKES